MAYVGSLELHSNRGGSSFLDVGDNHYVGRTSSAYRIYYKVPIRLDNETLDSLTLTTGVWVSDQGARQTNAINARLYANEVDAQAYNDNYISSASSGSTTFYATAKPVELSFYNLNLTSSATLYISFTTAQAASTKILEIVKYYYPDANTNNGYRQAAVSVNTTIDSYAIRYSANGGSSAPPTQYKYHGTALTLASGISKSDSRHGVTTTFDANGGTVSPASRESSVTTSYTFSGWKSSSGTIYVANDSYTRNEPTTMTAQWQLRLEGSSISLPTPARSGYTFLGWYDSVTGNAGYTPYSPVSNTTLYARWSANEYTVTFDPNGGHIFCSDSKVVTYDLEYGELPSYPEVRRNGYRFSGWKYGSKNISSSTKVDREGNHTLTASWDPIVYDVILHDENGDEVNTICINYDATYQLPSISRAGYNFTGWTTIAPTEDNPNGVSDGKTWYWESEGKWTNWEDEDYNNDINRIDLYPMWSPAMVYLDYCLYDTPVARSGLMDMHNFDLPPVTTILSTSDINPYHHVYGWCVKNIANGEEKCVEIANFNTILDNISEVSENGYGICKVHAKVTSRFKLLYIDSNGEVHRAHAEIVYDDTNRAVLPSIEV